MVNTTFPLNETVQQAGAIVDQQNIAVQILGFIRMVLAFIREGSAKILALFGVPMPAFTIPWVGVTVNIDLLLLGVSAWLSWKWMKKKFVGFDWVFFLTRTIIIFAILTFI